jgi:hypothetical protein
MSSEVPNLCWSISRKNTIRQFLRKETENHPPFTFSEFRAQKISPYIELYRQSQPYEYNNIEYAVIIR